MGSTLKQGEGESEDSSIRYETGSCASGGRGVRWAIAKTATSSAVKAEVLTAKKAGQPSSMAALDPYLEMERRHLANPTASTTTRIVVKDSTIRALGNRWGNENIVSEA
jgi:hypothetical protein